MLDPENELSAVDMNVQLNEGVNELQANLPDNFSSEMLFYFSAPMDYLGNQVRENIYTCVLSY